MNKKCAENQIVRDENENKVGNNLIIIWARNNSHYRNWVFRLIIVNHSIDVNLQSARQT